MIHPLKSEVGNIAFSYLGKWGNTHLWGYPLVPSTLLAGTLDSRPRTQGVILKRIRTEGLNKINTNYRWGFKDSWKQLYVKAWCNSLQSIVPAIFLKDYKNVVSKIFTPRQRWPVRIMRYYSLCLILGGSTHTVLCEAKIYFYSAGIFFPWSSKTQNIFFKYLVISGKLYFLQCQGNVREF